ncbi:kelch-like protein 33 isoform X1 [Balearica regulorum gibbericeps]|uniref:kelch-like protein 33 isoform X1 n=2 Tax=Balearica regulorum gibbericeps TaxID=100784 RepID=UPI003F5F5F84
MPCSNAGHGIRHAPRRAAKRTARARTRDTMQTQRATRKMWVAEGPAPAQWHLRDGAHAGHFLATADHLRTAGQLVDVAVGPEGDMAHAVVLASISSFFLRFLEGRTRELRHGPPPHVPLPPGATLWGWRAVLAFAYGGAVPHGREKEVEEAARVLGAPRVMAACAPQLESDPQEGGPEPLEEQWETLRAMEQLHASGLGCDLQLRAGDEVIPVQRLALSCSCDFFRALFTCPMREATHDPAAPLATGLSPAELRLLLSFAYTGAVAGPWPTVLEAAETSLRYQAWGLLTLCLDVFTHGLTPETGLDVLAFAVTYGLAQVGRVAEDYILATFPSVVATQAFLDLPAHLLIRLLRSDGLNVLHELEALEAASRWLMANRDDQEDLAKEVLSSVRFALMSGQELKKVPSVTAGVADPKVLHELVVASLSPMAQLPCRVRSLQEVLVVCGGDKLTTNMAARKPSRHLWFAHRYLSAVGLVKQVEWRALGHFPDGPRFRHAVAVVGNILYVLGGKRYYGVRDTLASVYRYQPMDDSWERLASMTCGRSYFAAAALGDFIYALGGSSGDLYCTDTVECYDLANDTWRRCQPLPMALCGHAASALDGALYVSGGCDEAFQCQTSLLRYMPGAPATVLAPMNGQRAGHIMEEAGGQLYVAGGLCQRDGQTGYRDQLAFEVYSPKLDIWVLLSPLPHAHVVGGAAVLGGELLVLGGYSHETYRDTHLIHAYQPGTRRWITRGTLPHAYTDLQACVLTVPPALRGPAYPEDPSRSPDTPNNT